MDLSVAKLVGLGIHSPSCHIYLVAKQVGLRGIYPTVLQGIHAPSRHVDLVFGVSVPWVFVPESCGFSMLRAAASSSSMRIFHLTFGGIVPKLVSG